MGGRFGAPLRDRAAMDAPEKETVPEAFCRNMDNPPASHVKAAIFDMKIVPKGAKA